MDLLLRVHRRTGDSSMWQGRRAHARSHGGAAGYTITSAAASAVTALIRNGSSRTSRRCSTTRGWSARSTSTRFRFRTNRFTRESPPIIFDYVLSDLQSPEGGFYSSRDADSEGLEGKFYIWTKPEILQVLGIEEGEQFCQYFDVTDKGNWFERRGHAPAGPKNIPHIVKSLEVFARLHGVSAVELDEKIADWRVKLQAVRARRGPSRIG